MIDLETNKMKKLLLLLIILLLSSSCFAQFKVPREIRFRQMVQLAEQKHVHKLDINEVKHQHKIWRMRAVVTNRVEKIRAGSIRNARYVSSYRLQSLNSYACRLSVNYGRSPFYY